MKNHKFFERYLNNDLSALTAQLLEAKEVVATLPSKHDYFASSGSVSTEKWNDYNVFQFYSPELHSLYKGIEEMVREACEYYELDFDNQKYYVQGWFNVNNKGKGKLDWHDHSNGEFVPLFHGYYCVKAEPSITYYKVNGEVVENHNKDNRAILSEMGHPHAMGDWDWEGDRITIAYDVIPLERLIGLQPQHWIPLV